MIIIINDFYVKTTIKRSRNSSSSTHRPPLHHTHITISCQSFISTNCRFKRSQASRWVFSSQSRDQSFQLLSLRIRKTSPENSGGPCFGHCTPLTRLILCRCQVSGVSVRTYAFQTTQHRSTRMPLLVVAPTWRLKLGFAPL